MHDIGASSSREHFHVVWLGLHCLWARWSADEIAKASVFLASADSSYSTGRRLESIWSAGGFGITYEARTLRASIERVAPSG